MIARCPSLFQLQRRRLDGVLVCTHYIGVSRAYHQRAAGLPVSANQRIAIARAGQRGVVIREQAARHRFRWEGNRIARRHSHRRSEICLTRRRCRRIQDNRVRRPPSGWGNARHVAGETIHRPGLVHLQRGCLARICIGTHERRVGGRNCKACWQCRIGQCAHGVVATDRGRVVGDICPGFRGQCDHVTCAHHYCSTASRRVTRI